MTVSEPKTPPTKKGMAALPIFWQLLGLCVLVLVMSVVVNAALILFTPPPQPSGYTLSEAVQAINSGSVKLRNGKTLNAVTQKSPPKPSRRSEGMNEGRRDAINQIIREHLARKLNLRIEQITVDTEPFGPPRKFLRNGVRYDYDKAKLDKGPFGNGDAGAPGMGPQGAGAPPPNSADGLARGDRMVIFSERPQGAGPGPGSAPPERREARAFEGGPRPGFHLGMTPGFDEQVTFPPFTAAIHLANGQYRVLVPPRNWLEPWQWWLLLGLGLTALSIAPLAFFLSRRISAPMVALAEGASQMGFGPDAAPLRVKGSREVRAATDALNALQVRLKSYVDNRTALITGIAHDLKTPLARLRLRVETLPEDFRAKFNADITHMDALINSALGFASAERSSLRRVPLDLGSLIESLCEDLDGEDAVRATEIEGGLTVSGDATALKRVLTNLIENAHRYAGAAEVIAHIHPQKPDMIEVIVRDHGPGLPQDSLEAVFEPFFRLENSRNRDTGGVGLGLSLARKLIEAHDGNLTLQNRITEGKTEGLDAVISLPKWIKP